MIPGTSITTSTATVTPRLRGQAGATPGSSLERRGSVQFCLPRRRDLAVTLALLGVVTLAVAVLAVLFLAAGTSAAEDADAAIGGHREGRCVVTGLGNLPIAGDSGKNT